MADHVRREGVGPALVLCSPARRARETAERIVPALVDDPPVEFDDELYDTSAQCLLERLRAIDDAAPSVMLIGHNPSLEALAVDLAGRGAKLDELRRKYPTAALATLEFAGSWRDLGPAKAELTDFVTPKTVAKG